MNAVEHVGEVVNDALSWMGTVPDWGDVPSWVAAVATGVIAVFAHRLQKAANATAARALEHELEDEARNVTWWVEDVVSQDPRDLDNKHYRPFVGDAEARFAPDPSTWPEHVHSRAWARIMVRNENTATSVSAVVLKAHSVEVDPAHQGEREVGSLRAGTQNFVVLALIGFGVSGEHGSTMREDVQGNSYAEWLQFTDSRGRTWRRHADGRLERLETTEQ